MERIKDFFNTITEDDLTPREVLLLILAAFFGGMLIGVLISPVKKGLAVFSHNKLGNQPAPRNEDGCDCCGYCDCDDCEDDNNCCCD